MNTDRLVYARCAGALYLLTHVTSVSAVAAYGGGLTALGVALEFLLAMGCAGTGILLWLLLRGRGPAQAATFAMLRGVEAAVIVSGALPMFAMLHAGVTTSSDALLLEGIHLGGFLLGQGLVISVNTIVLGSLLLTSRAVPRALGVLAVAGGGIVLVSNTAQLFGVIPLNGAVAGVCAAPVFAFELWFAVHLIVRGVAADDTAADGATVRTRAVHP